MTGLGGGQCLRQEGVSNRTLKLYAESWEPLGRTFRIPTDMELEKETKNLTVIMI